MLRSEIDRAIDDAIVFFREMRFPLPEYADWTLARFASMTCGPRSIDVGVFDPGHTVQRIGKVD